MNENDYKGSIKYEYNPEHDEYLINKFINEKDNLHPNNYGYFYDKKFENNNKYLYNHSFAINKIMGNKNESLEIELSELRKENLYYKTKTNEIREELRKCYSLISKWKNERNSDQVEINNKLQDNRFYNSKWETEIIKNKTLLDDYNNLKSQNAILKNKIENFDQDSKLNIENWMLWITEKNKENCDMKYKLNQALELKRKLEVNNQTVNFELENLKNRYSSDIKEKEVRYKMDHRNFENLIDMKNIEFKEIMNKLISLENDKQLTISENENLKLKIENLKNIKNNDNYNYNYENNDNNNITKKRKFNEDIVNNNNINEKKLRLNFNMRSEALVDIVSNQYNSKIKEIFLNKWISQLKLKKTMEHKDKIDLKNYKNSKFNIDNLDSILIYYREKWVMYLFDIFIKSVDKANTKKSNSLILFILKFNELKNINNQIFKFNLKTYFNIYSLIKDIKVKKNDEEFKKYLTFYYKLNKNLDLTDNQINDLELAKPNFELNKNNVNSWIENSLIKTLNQKTNDKNKEFLLLFRLLTILFRIKFPLRGKEIMIENSLEFFIFHKILEAFQSILKLK